MSDVKTYVSQVIDTLGNEIDLEPANQDALRRELTFLRRVRENLLPNGPEITDDTQHFVHSVLTAVKRASLSNDPLFQNEIGWTGVAAQLNSIR